MKLVLGTISRCIQHAQDDTGVAAVEFGLLLPVLLLVVLGGVVFSIALANYHILNNAADVGASNLILSRGSATPYSSTVGAIDAATPTLTTANLTITMTVNGTSCASDTACQTALSTAASQQASVSITYPCNLTVMGINFAPSGCTLKASTVGLVQ